MEGHGRPGYLIRDDMSSCLFCSIRNKEAHPHTLWEDEQFLAFLDIRPLNPGHTLIIPKKHIGYIFDIKDPLYSDLFRTAKKLSVPLQKVTKAKKIAFAVEGFGVPHVHVHLVPINNPGDLDPRRARKATEEELSRERKKIQKELDSHQRL